MRQEQFSSRYSGIVGRRVAITGGAGGIGRATSLMLLEQGARVAVADIDAASLSSLAQLAGSRPGELRTSKVDVRDEGRMAEWFAELRALWGGIDLAVSSAGIELHDQDSAVHTLTSNVWKNTLDVNLTGGFHFAKYAVQALLQSDQPSLVFVGSPTGTHGMELGRHAYSASKAGVHGLARVMANEYAPLGLRVNVVLPGFIATSMNAAVLSDPGALKEVEDSIPMRRSGKPEEIAAFICFLLSADSSYCTGGMYYVDGGLTAV